jgi:hypothetical protein
MTILSLTWNSLGTSGGALWAAGGALAAGAWAFHVWRLRRRERALLGLVEERTREWARERAARAYTAPSAPWTSGAEEGVEDDNVLALVSPGNRGDVLRRLASLGIDAAFADSAWSTRAACRDAFDAGRPYNLVLLDATHPDVLEPGVATALQADLDHWGARVGVMRPGGSRRTGRAGVTGRRDAEPESAMPADDECLEEGIGVDENPDRRGRSGFAPAAAADPAAVGLRSRRGE